MKPAAALVSVVVPVRAGESVERTMASLTRQSCQRLEVHVVVDADGRGAPWARNQGAARAVAPYLLFSDADIDWDPDALDVMLRRLQAAEAEEQRRPRPPLLTAYAYGGYRLVGARGATTVHANEPWDLDTLKQRNLVSTMALLRRTAFTGFDERLTRLQDWDLWLGLALHRRLRGAWCGRTLFSTPYNPAGITAQGDASYRAAWLAVRRKHRLGAAA